MIGAFDIIYCPYCAYRGKLYDFRITKKSGTVSRKKFRCPDCEQVMLRRTMLREFSIDDWAKWLYVSIRIFKFKGEPERDFYGRISWSKLLSRLNDYGFSERFWDTWKYIKEHYSKLPSEEIDKILEKGLPEFKEKVRLSKWL